jgi:hypothetical protein
MVNHAVMGEEPTIIRMNVAHYQSVLELDLDAEKRSMVCRLLEEAMENLLLTTKFR